MKKNRLAAVLAAVMLANAAAPVTTYASYDITMDDLTDVESMVNEAPEIEVGADSEEEQSEAAEVPDVEITSDTSNSSGTITAELTEDESTITVTTADIDPNASEVNVAVWSKANGQDDVTWTPAGIAQETGLWTAYIPIRGHADTGVFEIHCYQTIDGTPVFLDDATIRVTRPTAKVFVEDSDNVKDTFTIRVTDINAHTGVAEVRTAVWSVADGQDDIVWQTAELTDDGYKVEVSSMDHNFDVGKYVVKAFVVDGNGIATTVGKGVTYMVYESGADVVLADDQATVDVVARGYDTSEEIKVAIWSEADEQDDLAWYVLTPTANGRGAKATISIADHGSSGPYQAHVYSGDKVLTTETFEVTTPTADVFEISEVDGSKGTFRVALSGINCPAGVEKVRFGVWPEGAYAELFWYTAVREGDIYYTEVNVSNHGRYFGNYIVHAYVDGKNGISSDMMEKNVEISATNYTYIETLSYYVRRGWYVDGADRATNVRFATWSEDGGQDDIIWYQGYKEGHSWFFQIDIASHATGGIFESDVYATIDGVEQPVATFFFSLPLLHESETTGHLPIEAGSALMNETAQKLYSQTDFLILVNRAFHRVSIYQGSKGNWTNIAYWPCVVGADATPTIAGEYEVMGRFYWFGDNYRLWYPLQIKGYYLFHSQAYKIADSPISLLDPTMDTASSHGCVRLYLENEKWMWDNIPRGTKIYIYN